MRTPTPSDSASATASATATPTGSPSATATPTPTPTISGPISGPDVASYQHPATAAYPHGKPINWTAVAQGRHGVRDRQGERVRRRTRTRSSPATTKASTDAGLVRGTYHFARPAYPVNTTAVAQADYFANLIGDVDTPATLPPILDLEVTGGLPARRPRDLGADLPVSLALSSPAARRCSTRIHRSGPTCSPTRAPSRGSRSGWRRTAIRCPAALRPPTCGSTRPPPRSAASVAASTSRRFVGTRGIEWDALSDGTATLPWPSTAPKPPHALVVTPGPTTATVSWTPGNDGSARVTSYTVTSNPDNITATVNGAESSATVKRLDPATSYTFTVTATSSAGTSEPSAATQAVTPIVPTLLAVTQPASIDYGHPLLISAVLNRTDTSAGVGDQTVTIYRRATGATDWVKQGTATTDSDGSVSVKLHPKRSIDVRITFKGSPGYEPDGALGSTVVHSVVTADLSKTAVRHGHDVKLTGAVAPVIEGVQVVRQELKGTTWVDGAHQDHHQGRHVLLPAAPDEEEDRSHVPGLHRGEPWSGLGRVADPPAHGAGRRRKRAAYRRLWPCSAHHSRMSPSHNTRETHVRSSMQDFPLTIGSILRFGERGLRRQRGRHAWRGRRAAAALLRRGGRAGGSARQRPARSRHRRRPARCDLHVEQRRAPRGLPGGALDGRGAAHAEHPAVPGAGHLHREPRRGQASSSSTTR